MSDNKNDARLAAAEGASHGGKMIAKVEDGRFALKPVDEVHAAELESVAKGLGLRPEMSTAQLEERTAKLLEIIREKMAWERDQIVAVVQGYAIDCQENANKLAAADSSNAQRAAAFEVRAAIAADIAIKIEQGWGRSPTGAVVLG